MGHGFSATAAQNDQWLTDAMVIGRRDLTLAHVDLGRQPIPPLLSTGFRPGRMAGRRETDAGDPSAPQIGAHVSLHDPTPADAHITGNAATWRPAALAGGRQSAVAAHLPSDGRRLESGRQAHFAAVSRHERGAPPAPLRASHSAHGGSAPSRQEHAPDWMGGSETPLLRVGRQGEAPGSSPRRLTITMQGAGDSSGARSLADLKGQTDALYTAPRTPNAGAGRQRGTVPLPPGMPPAGFQSRTIVGAPVPAANGLAGTPYGGAGRCDALRATQGGAAIPSAGNGQGPAAQAVMGTAAGGSPEGWPVAPASEAVGPGGSSGPASGQAPTEGDVYLDGTLVGRWMARTLGRAAGRPASGGTAFDPTRNRLPAGTMIGA